MQTVMLLLFELGVILRTLLALNNMLHIIFNVKTSDTRDDVPLPLFSEAKRFAASIFVSYKPGPMRQTAKC